MKNVIAAGIAPAASRNGTRAVPLSMMSVDPVKQSNPGFRNDDGHPDSAWKSPADADHSCAYNYSYYPVDRTIKWLTKGNLDRVVNKTISVAFVSRFGLSRRCVTIVEPRFARNAGKAHTGYSRIGYQAVTFQLWRISA